MLWAEICELCEDLSVAPATAGPTRANASAAPAMMIAILRIHTLLAPGTRGVRNSGKVFVNAL